jgi:FG-GAP-like repeat
VLADFDGSGKPQIVVGESDPGGWGFGGNPNTQLNIYELIGNPADPAGWQKTTIDNIAAHELRTADLNGDGHPDLIADIENTNLLIPPRNGAVHYWLSNPSGATLPPRSTTPPTIYGTNRQGQTLKSTSDGWTGSTPIILRYQWKACDSNGNRCTDIPTATSQSYTLTRSDTRHTVRVMVIATNSAGTRSITSNATGQHRPHA